VADEGIKASEDALIAADVIGEAARQRVKVQYGTDGVGIDVSAGNPFPVAQTPLLGSGVTVARKVAAATTNATNVKASAAAVYGWELTNKSAEVRAVKLYNKASAPAPATDNALIVVSLVLPKESRFGLFLPVPLAGFTNGLGFAITKLPADTDNTAVTAEDVFLNLFYV